MPAYKLVSPLAAAAGTLDTTGFISPHMGLATSLTSDACAACHSTHTAQAQSLGRLALPVSNQCFSCHDGSASSLDVKVEFSGAPANDPATASYYQHPATVADSHAQDSDNEFGGVSNRHSSCVDCHQPHVADGTRPTQSTVGWSASGAIAGASGVAVTNTAGKAPTYAFTTTGLTFEYELCFKCHSGFTVPPAQAAGHPSWWALDAGVEFDPLNAKSYHPVEAAGTNQTQAMANSLSGVLPYTSPYKLWNFQVGDTVRCSNCHAGPATPAAGTTADAALAPHASANRGILIANYRDRQLKAPTNDPYDAADFALCYVCHAEAPFAQTSGIASLSATNFQGGGESLHAFHVTGIQGKGSGGASTDIDTPGAGQGDALCAECHFRLHSTAQAFDAGDRSNTRLVNFAPDVTPATVNGVPVLEWIAPTSTSPGSCTLTCHGVEHVNETYQP